MTHPPSPVTQITSCPKFAPLNWRWPGLNRQTNVWSYKAWQGGDSIPPIITDYKIIWTKNLYKEQRESKKGFFPEQGETNLNSQRYFYIPLFFFSDISKQRLICVKPIIFKPISTEWFEGKHCYHEGVSVSTWEIGGKRSDLILCTGDRGMVWPSTQKWKLQVVVLWNYKHYNPFIACIFYHAKLHIYLHLFWVFN